MKKKFIAYGSHSFSQSSKRIIEEADSLKIFDETQRYSDKDLPLSLQSSPLFLNEKKGGFWIWKAYVIYESLSRLKEGDILVYADSGCELKNSTDWEFYFDQLDASDAIFFQYREDKNYGWNAFNSNFNDSPKLKYWIKKTTADYFRTLFNSDEEWLEKNKLWAGFIILKKTKTSLQLIKDWLDVMIYNPNIVTDPLITERDNQISGFSAHRHDQSILSVIVRNYEKKTNLKILDEKSEGDYPNQIVKASRRVDKTEEKNLKSFLKRTYYRIKK